MNDPVPSLQRANLDALTVRVLARGRNWTKADVVLVQLGDRQYVVKDLRGWRPVRWLIGRYLLRREYDILAALRSVAGVPRVYEMLDADAFVMDFIDGKNIGGLPALSAATMERVERLVAQLHAHGVAHGDPHGRNILVTATGEPFLIDFGTAQRLPPQTQGWRAWLWRQAQQQDRRRVAKMKQKFTPDRLTAEDDQLLNSPSRFYRSVKAVRRVVELVTLKKLRLRRQAHLKTGP